ncbi:MAG: hypothetical protein HZA16_11530 [Nitrospirae bacterium]|nr:hypothetical protein [Nitrospirota bacterium]
MNIPPDRFTDYEIQKHAYNKMMNPRFDVLSLANSIEAVGFLQVDSIVAKNLDNVNHVVIEGNRRTTALKYIVNQFKLGQSLLSEHSIKQLSNVDILMVDNSEDDIESIGKIIQGIRNVSGVKEWDAYQKAQFVNEMITKGKTPSIISKMIGMQVKDINRYYKTYSAMTRFRKDEEYGSKWKHSYFSYFDEVLKRPLLRKYLGWDEEKFQFTKTDELCRFYDWIIPNEDGVAAITDHRDIRQIAALLGDEVALNYIDDRNFQKAMTYYEQKNLNVSKTTLPECISKITGAIDAFKNIIGESLEVDMTKDDLDEIEKKIDDMKKQVNRIRILKENES